MIAYLHTNSLQQLVAELPPVAHHFLKMVKNLSFSGADTSVSLEAQHLKWTEEIQKRHQQTKNLLDATLKENPEARIKRYLELQKLSSDTLHTLHLFTLRNKIVSKKMIANFLDGFQEIERRIVADNAPKGSEQDAMNVVPFEVTYPESEVLELASA